ncbi:Manganese lipoxygenase [Madurella fahalii]|uniref:Manganese lipoxygenase n=1 Tax=Madurella fahalii TaxID=1157608 RepID=A0ABQ0GT64_9PEZI
MPPETHQYPGVNLPLRYLDQQGTPGVDFYRLGSFEGLQDVTSRMLQVREVAMMILMDSLTDKPNWHEKVFDDDIVDKWRQEALSQDEDDLYLQVLGGKAIPMLERTRIISERAFDYCIAELRCKAAHFKESGLIFTLNADGNTVIKSDSLISDELRQGLKAAFEKLRAEQGAEPEWHPWTDDKVQDLVHPSMHPFVYGKSKFIQEEVVGVADAIEKWSGKGEIVQKDKEIAHDDPRPAWQRVEVPADYWSSTYQWLPANLSFQEDGTVRFTSYINNLHPKKHREIYRLVEKLVDAAIPAWDRVLSGVAMIDGKEEMQKRFDLPPEVFEDDEVTNWEPFNPDVLAAWEKEVGEIAISDPYLVEAWEDYVEVDEDTPETTKEEMKAEWISKLKWREIRDPLLPEPLDFGPVAYRIAQSLRGKFKDTGLQVIIKMASIELTPEKPEFPVGGWHVEGQMNEHIVATALYYLDSENVTPSRLSFRMMTDGDQEDMQVRVGQNLYGSYERIFGTRLYYDPENGNTVQNYGDIETREGRLVAFPNVFQHRVSSFSLQDRTRPGHRRFIALWLVDPHQRIISTANVPPQQLDWWAEAVFGTESQAVVGEMPSELFQLLLEQGVAQSVKPSQEMLSKMSSRLPAEVLDMVRREQVLPEGIMTLDEARQHRLRLMEERSAFQVKGEEEWRNSYSFCEH